MSRTTGTIDVQPIDRLEEKVRQLVAMIDTLRNERARAMDEAARLQHELDAAKSRIAEAAGATAEVAALREERELIRNRVAQMISQIDKINL
jgi:regulator of replication initiation timing